LDSFDKFQRVQQTTGSQADVAYALAACQYQLKDYKGVVRSCSDIISTAGNDHPGRPPVTQITIGPVAVALRRCSPQSPSVVYSWLPAHMLRADIVFAGVCVSVCLSAQNLENCRSEIDVTWREYVPRGTLEEFGSW